MSPKRSFHVISILLFLFFCICPSVFAAFNLLATPNDGGFDLRFNRVSPNDFKVASSVTSADSNIMNVSMEDRFKEDSVTIRFTIQVYDRLHLSKVMRSLRANPDVMRVTRTRAV